MHYYNLFFLKHEYSGFDRFIVANTCILLSAKLLGLHKEMTSKFLVQNYITMKKTMVSTPVDDSQAARDIVMKEILRLEQQVMQASDFNMDIALVSPYVDKYMQMMAPSHYTDKNSPLRVLAQAVANDSAYTHANLVYSTQTVALACCVATLKFFDLKLPATEGFDYNGILK